MIAASACILLGAVVAVTAATAKRVATVPEVPTIAESGLPGYEVAQWFGIAAPDGLPRTIVTKLNQEIVTILTHSDAREALIRQGMEPVGGTPDEFAAHIKSELAKWTRVFKEMGLQVEPPR